MQLYQLREHFSEEEVTNFSQFMKLSTWYSNIPGGFLTNSPKRQVNAYGDGSEITDSGDIGANGWQQTYWTAKISQNNVSLQTPTEAMPEALSKLVPGLRRLFSKTFPDAVITPNTFSIAVCNNYSDPDMNIAGHTDDNPWYPRESGVGPVFASITLYPEGEPEVYARFGVKQDGKWKQVDLPHESILIMPSSIEHRVQPYLKSKRDKFKPRINLTFRSIYPFNRNPIMHNMAVANHTRYYKMPLCIIFPEGLEEEKRNEILEVYNRFCESNGGSKLHEFTRKLNKSSELTRYRGIKDRNGYMDFRSSPNIVAETLKMVSDRIVS